MIVGLVLKVNLFCWYVEVCLLGWFRGLKIVIWYFFVVRSVLVDKFLILVLIIIVCGCLDRLVFVFGGENCWVIFMLGFLFF